MEYWKQFKSVPGPRKCMRCGVVFESPDRVRIRRCPDCKRNEGPAGPHMYSTRDMRGLSGSGPSKGDAT